MKGPLERPVRDEAEAVAGLTDDLVVTRVGRRGESRLLALVGVSVVILVGISAIKPWGAGTSIGRGSATPSARASAVQRLVSVPSTMPLDVAIGPDSTTSWYWSCVQILDDPGQSPDPRVPATAAPQLHWLVSGPVPYAQSGGGLVIGSDCQGELDRIDAMTRYLESSQPSSK